MHVPGENAQEVGVAALPGRPRQRQSVIGNALSVRLKSINSALFDRPGGHPMPGASGSQISTAKQHASFHELCHGRGRHHKAEAIS